MSNLRETVSQNLVRLRKENNLTQIELSQKINFSDKAVSRWEKGEVLPDIETIEKLSEVFNVPMSAIIESQDEPKTKPRLGRLTKQELLSHIFLICEIWTIISVVYAYVNISMGHNIWQIFVWGVPATALFLIVQSKKNKNNLISFIYGTIFVWSFIASFFFHMLDSCPWYFFILGVPVQGMLIVRHVFNYHTGLSSKWKNRINQKSTK